jgi:hypothetical protein
MRKLLVDAKLCLAAANGQSDRRANDCALRVKHEQRGNDIAFADVAMRNTGSPSYRLS